MPITISDLDNTATPYYYGLFREDVLAGKIPVCDMLSLEMNRIDRLIRNPEIFYYREPVEAFIRFCENELVKTDGDSLVMLPTFKLWAEQVFCWYYLEPTEIWVDTEDGGHFEDRLKIKRLIKKQYLIVARGAAKSMYASFIHSYFLVMDGKTSTHVVTAPTMRQAEEILSPIRTAILRAVGPLIKFLTANFEYKLPGNKRHPTMLGVTKDGITNFLTGTVIEVRPMSVPKLQGLRNKITSIDEWLSGETPDDVVSAIEQGASKLENYLIIAVSSEGTVRNRIGDTMKLELIKILTGEFDAPDTSIFYYRLDDIKEVANPRMWRKAHPTIGITVPYEVYRKDVLRAEKVPSAAHDILAKRFGIPMEGYSLFFRHEEIQPHPPQSFKKYECALGVDLSQGDDFCSFTFLFPINDQTFGIKTLNFITDRTLGGLPTASRVLYDSFINEGSLIVLNGSVLDMNEVFSHVEDHIDENEYYVNAVGYDPYNADLFINLFKQTYGAYNVEAVRQGAKTASVPLGEIKKLAEDRALLFDERMMTFAMGNTMVIEAVSTGVRKLFKRRYSDKIDPVAALVNAYVMYKKYPDFN